MPDRTGSGRSGPDDHLAGVGITLEPGESPRQLGQADGLGHHRQHVEAPPVEQRRGCRRSPAGRSTRRSADRAPCRWPRKGRSPGSGGRSPPPPARPSTAATSMACSMSPGRPLHSRTTVGPPPVASAMGAPTGPAVGSNVAVAPDSARQLPPERGRARSRHRLHAHGPSPGHGGQADRPGTQHGQPVGSGDLAAPKGMAHHRQRFHQWLLVGGEGRRQGEQLVAPHRHELGETAGPLQADELELRAVVGATARAVRAVATPANGRTATAVPVGQRSGSTPAPTAATTPAISWPRPTPGSASWLARWRSLPQIPHPVTRSSASPGPGEGVGTSASSSFGRSSVRTAACNGQPPMTTTGGSGMPCCSAQAAR